MNDNNDEIQLPDYVLVNPLLTDDPAFRQGQIGVITAAILNTDEFIIGFDDSQVGLYSASALLFLKQLEDIYKYMYEKVSWLSADDFKDLKNIALLLDYGTKTQIRTALVLAQKNENILNGATTGLDERIGLNQGYKRGR